MKSTSMNVLLTASILLLVTVNSCRKDQFRANVSGIELNLDIRRFETELFGVDPSVIESFIPQWESEYGIFFQHFNYVMGLGNSSDPEYSGRLREFVTDQMNYRIYERTMEVFPDLDSLTDELTLAFKRFRYFLPEKTVPRIVTFVSGFNQTAISDEGLLAVGLDKYLGINEPMYAQVGVYQYLLQNMHPKKVVSDCMLFWAETEFSFNDSVDNLISHMIYRGKLMYFLNALVPEQPDTIRWGFTADQMNFCLTNEKQMWTYLVSNKLLFDTDRFTINKFILEGPFTNDFTNESPGRAAVWIGYRIVDSYMKKNPRMTMEEVLQEDDYMNILNLSAYNP